MNSSRTVLRGTVTFLHQAIKAALPGLMVGAIVVPLSLGVTTSARAELISVGYNGGVWSINQSTGAETYIGPTGFFALNGAAADSSHDIYASSASLLTIDPGTGAGTAVGPLGDIRGLAFSDLDILYGIQSVVAGHDDLVTIDTATGDISLAATTDAGLLQALAFSPSAALNAWDNYYGLITINPVTGDITDVNPGIGGSTYIQGLEFTPDGALYGIGNEFFAIDISTGEASPVGGSFSSMRGLAYIPEPSTAILLGLGLAVLGGRRSRQQ